MTERGPGDGQDREPEREQDPVNHHPPEEWRPGDAGDPVTGGAQPPGEPPHRFPRHDPPHAFPPSPHGGPAPAAPEEGSGTLPENGSYPAFAPPPGARSQGPGKLQGDPYRGLGTGHSGSGHPPPEGPVGESGPGKVQGDPYRNQDAPTGGRPSEPGENGQDGTGGTGGQQPFAGPGGQTPFGHPPGGHPTGAPPEPVRRTGEPSEGPNGLDQSGYEHAGYAPGYGESDTPGVGAGSFPTAGPPPEYGAPAPGTLPQGAHPDHAYPPGGYPPGTYASGSHGYPPGGGYAPPRAPSASWGKILGIGCGAALVLMLVAGGCMALAMFTVSETSSTTQDPGTEEPWPSDGPPVEDTEVTAGATDFVPSPLYTGGEYTSVDVSVTNNSEEQIDVNPLYFTVVDDGGENHSSRTGVGMDANEIGAEPVAPGQATGGTVTVEGELEPERLIFAPIGHRPLEVPVD